MSKLAATSWPGNSQNKGLVLTTARLTKLSAHRSLAARAGAILAAALLSSCHDTFALIGGNAPKTPARARATAFFASLGARVTEAQRDAKYDYARIEIANSAMIPSRVWGDSAVWTSGSTSRRTLSVSGRFVPPRYRLDAVRFAPIPTQTAESRHVINLTRLSENEYSWDTDVQYALGSISAPEIAAFTRALFTGAEGRHEREIRADYAAAAPQTTAVASQLFEIDSIRTSIFGDSSTLATYAITMRPDRVEKRLPALAAYARRYLATADLKITLSDRNGQQYLSLTSDDGRIFMKVRTRRGAIVSMNGPVTPMPDTLILGGGLTMKVRRFTVGFKDYDAEFTIVHNDHESSWTIITRKEPNWVLPIFTETLLHTPLRRPFRGSGTLFKIGVRDSVGGQSLLVRRLHLEVQESAILRFVGKLGASAVGDYEGKSERELQQWLRELFAALVADIGT